MLITILLAIVMFYVRLNVAILAVVLNDSSKLLIGQYIITIECLYVFLGCFELSDEIV